MPSEEVQMQFNQAVLDHLDRLQTSLDNLQENQVNGKLLQEVERVSTLTVQHASQIQKINQTIFGPNGDNGMYRDIRWLKETVRDKIVPVISDWTDLKTKVNDLWTFKTEYGARNRVLLWLATPIVATLVSLGVTLLFSYLSGGK